MDIPNQTEKFSKPQQYGAKRNLLRSREDDFTDNDGSAAAALLNEIQLRQKKTETVKLSEIEDHEYLRIRDLSEKDTIDELVGKLRQGAILPPVVLMRSPDKKNEFYSLDGDYRLTANRTVRAETVEAVVVDCTLRQGLLLRLMLNNSHAKCLTKREKNS